jgi:hypothetical protein
MVRSVLHNFKIQRTSIHARIYCSPLVVIRRHKSDFVDFHSVCYSDYSLLGYYKYRLKGSCCLFLEIDKFMWRMK